MSGTVDLQALAGAGQARPVYTKAQMLRIMADALYAMRGKKKLRGLRIFTLMGYRGVEYVPLKQLRKTRLTGIMRILKRTLQDRDIQVGRTIGSFMDATQLTVDDLDATVCYCHGEKSDASVFSDRIRRRAEKYA